jgi:hypothetical protein
MGEAAFIDLHLTHRSDGSVQGTPPGEFELDPDGLQSLGAHGHDVFCSSWCLCDRVLGMSSCA